MNRQGLLYLAQLYQIRAQISADIDPMWAEVMRMGYDAVASAFNGHINPAVETEQPGGGFGPITA